MVVLKLATPTVQEILLKVLKACHTFERVSLVTLVMIGLIAKNFLNRLIPGLKNGACKSLNAIPSMNLFLGNFRWKKWKENFVFIGLDWMIICILISAQRCHK